MPPQTARHTILSAIAPYDAETEDLRIVIETPKSSRNKYSYDPECDCLQLSTVLPEGMVFPYDFGFIPSTLGDDGYDRYSDSDGSAGGTRLRRHGPLDRRDRGRAERERTGGRTPGSTGWSPSRPTPRPIRRRRASAISVLTLSMKLLNFW